MKKFEQKIEQVKSLYNECRKELMKNGNLQFDDLEEDLVRCYGGDTDDILDDYCDQVNEIIADFDEEERGDFYWKLNSCLGYVGNLDEYVDENDEQVSDDFFFNYTSDCGNFFNFSDIPEEMRDKIEESDAKQQVREVVNDIVIEAKNLVQLCAEKCTSVTFDVSDAEHAGSKMVLYYDANNEAFEIPFDMVQVFENWDIVNLKDLTLKYYDYDCNDLMSFGIDCLRNSDIPNPDVLIGAWCVWTSALFSACRETDCEHVQFKLEDVKNEADREKLQRLLDKAYEELDEDEEEE